MAVVIETTIGDFTVDLYTEQRPQTCRNFLKLCKVKYYNWNLFHTVQSNFIAQTGDPTGTGKGGESIYGRLLGEEARYYEAEQMPRIKHDKVGLLSMVNCGNNMLGSQFFITLDRDLQSLDGEHCVFGEIAEGLEVILKFNEAICDHDHRPYQDIRISHTVILEDPYDDPKTLVIPDRSPEPTREALMSDRIGADEAIDDTAGLSMEQITEIQKEKEAKARATILEIVGDIPDAEMAPPENVLFVCKLNPVTNDDDLEIIFSRFGRIVGCEVIRDRKTGDSLQYAFIEFADRKSCEEAYFKMDNVLIDDRRIHVDFSQSVSKMRWRGKGKGIMYNEDKDKGEKKSKPDAFESRGGRDRRKNSNDHRDSKSEARTNDKNREERPKSLKHDKRRAEKYRRENDDERYDKRRDNNERNNDRRRDRAKDKSNRTEMRSRRESRSRSGERRYNEKPFDRRGKRQDDDKRRDYLDGRSEKNDRVRQGDKRPREHSEERYRRKKDYRHDKYK
ncbi:peptidyl-prolyl cis-trans isomerase sig-7 isoform X1 [Venturia canescens]|uniref:peptidyl-prolyl cis-trans isomerase sig-7 isoform X1 n=2 Tax=Venturia canescens TaxID=32260 RepID=UPI001C9BD827|nr:peptidyl-prolyl cis-trans isomerase sig-7 isoform X1 [Venturia canescens]